MFKGRDRKPVEAGTGMRAGQAGSKGAEDQAGPGQRATQLTLCEAALCSRVLGNHWKVFSRGLTIASILKYLLLLLFYILAVWQDLSSLTGMNPWPPAVGEASLNYWATRGLA